MTKKKFLIFLFLFALSVGAYSTYRRWLPEIAWFKIEDILISAEAPLTESELRKSISDLKGKNLLLLDGNVLMQKLLSHPWAATASIKKELPNRLVITVQAKKPFAARQDGSRLTILDDKGAEIERWSMKRVADSDLPIIAFEKPELAKQWNASTLVTILARLQKAIAPKHRLSQIVAADPPYFKVFLTSPPLEMLFSLHTWEGQLPFFVDLLGHPPRQIGQAHRINLVFPKKAVVSFPLSH